MNKHPYIDKSGAYVDPTPEHHFDPALCSEILVILKSHAIHDMYEFGCGSGNYSKKIIDSGIQVDASDGNPYTAEITLGLSRCLDISKPLHLAKKQAVLCLEVGEHVPVEFEKNVLDNFANHATDLLVISWAIVGQGGRGHVNCRNNDYIINQIESRGFVYDVGKSQLLRERSSISWFKNTVMIFHKTK